jgi:pimeloyl-ACP methyl ester carboxylesterase
VPKRKKMRKNNTAVDYRESVVTGKIKQWISVRTKSTDNPILLFLHGGPGTAQISFSRKSQKRLEDEFIVVNWDQRGAGYSYSKSIVKGDMGIENFINDTEEMIKYLLKKFGKSKLFLAGHSWGSYLGIKTAGKHPELLWAYIGIGQIINMKKGEELSYEYVLNEAKKRRNNRAVNSLQKIGRPPYKAMKAAGIQRKWLYKFHGATAKSTTMKYILSNITWKDTSFTEFIKFIKGVIFSLSCLETEMMNINIENDVKEIKIPVVFCEGRHDYNVPAVLVEQYLPVMRAKEKRIVWFEKSGHLPNFEEADKFCSVCIELKHTCGYQNIPA